MKETRTEYEVHKTKKSVEVEDYEKVEVEKEVYVCDSCEQEYYADEDVTIHTIAVNPPEEITEEVETFRDLEDFIRSGYSTATSEAMEYGMGTTTLIDKPLQQTIGREYKERNKSNQTIGGSRMKTSMEAKVPDSAVVTDTGTAYFFRYCIRLPVDYQVTKHMCEYCYDSTFS